MRDSHFDGAFLPSRRPVAMVKYNLCVHFSFIFKVKCFTNFYPMFTPSVLRVNILHFHIPKSTYFDRFSLNAVFKESSQIPNK